MSRSVWFEKLRAGIGTVATPLPLPNTAIRRSQSWSRRFVARTIVAFITVAGLATIAWHSSSWREAVFPTKVFSQASTEAAAAAPDTARAAPGLPRTMLTKAPGKIPFQDEKPPTRAELGRAGWTLLHSIAANYPEVATPEMQTHARQFIASFAALYPCPTCREHFQGYVRTHPPALESREQFVKWCCRAHNAVNLRLGKSTIPCTDLQLLDKRWRDCHCDEQEPQNMIRAARRLIESRRPNAG
jgi:FAD-linked sulfhydryl oxidase